MLPIGGRVTGGLTESERYLARLCEQSFLTLWSHPNLFMKVSKELCDLLVVFGDDLIIFSDKSCAMQHGLHGWSRWYRRSVLDSARQLHRAAGWLRKHPQNVFLDAKCTERFPIALPESSRIHLVAVAVGAADACRQHFGGGTGSLGIMPDGDGTAPFIIGDLDPKRDFVHVFDEVTLDIVLRELDTIEDFVGYLRAKVEFLRSGRVGLVVGEEDLLAYYLLGEQSFRIPDNIGDQQIGIKDTWDFLIRSPRYAAKKAEDRVSYLWDELIERIAHACLSQNLDPIGETDVQSTERGLRLMARESRLARRALAVSLTNFMWKADKQEVGYNTARLLDRPDEAYVFVSVGRPPGVTDLEYHRGRQALLEARCTTVKGDNPHLRRIVGLGFARPRDGDGTIDLVVDTHGRDWTEAEIESANELRRHLGWEPSSELRATRDGFMNFPRPPSNRALRSEETDAQKRKAKRKAERAARKRQRR